MTEPTPAGPTPMSDALRRAILASGLPLLTLQQATGVHRGSISRFVRGERSLRLDMADKLASYLNLELAPAARPRGE